MSDDARADVTGATSSVEVVIVNYRTSALVVDCLASLAGEVGGSRRVSVTVVDNASDDGSADEIEGAIARDGWGDWARLVRAPRNGGFAYGNNLAIRAAIESASPPDHLLLLNPDTRVRPGAVHALADFLDSHPRAGFAGSRLEHPDGEQQHSRFRFPSILREFEGCARLGAVCRLLPRASVAIPLDDSDDPLQVDWLSGASLMVRADVIRDVGPMDEGYFLYYEETDYCRAAARFGWTCWFVPTSRVVHLVGRSTGVTNAADLAKRRPSYWYESRRDYFRKHHGVLYSLMADAAAVAGASTQRLKSALKRRRSDLPRRFALDLIASSVRSR